MKIKQYIKYIASPAKVLVTIIIILSAVTMLQAIVAETVHVFARRTQTPPQKQAEEPNEQEAKYRRISGYSKECLPDGTIHLVHNSNRKSSYDLDDHNRHSVVYDTNDNVLWKGLSKDLPYDYISWAAEPLSAHYGSSDVRRLKSVAPDGVGTIEVPVGTGKKTKQIWRFLPDSERFVGYDLEGSTIGYIGANGFADSKSATEPLAQSRAFFAWCPEDSHSPTLLWQTETKVYQIDFENKKVVTLFSHPDSEIERLYIHKWGAHKPNIPGSDLKYKPMLYCRTWDGKHHVILNDPVRHITIDPTEDWGIWHNNYCRFAATEEGILMHRIQFDVGMMYHTFKSRQAYDKWWRQYQAKPRTQAVTLYKVTDSGTLDQLNRFEYTWPPHLMRNSPDALRQKTRYAVSQFSPPLYDLICQAFVRDFWRNDYVRPRSETVRELLQALTEVRPAFGMPSLLITALITAFAAWHAIPRKTSRAALIFWLAFVALFNVAGLLTYLALNHTPIIICTACKKRRGLLQPQCTRCAANLPTPKPGPLDLITTPAPTT